MQIFVQNLNNETSTLDLESSASVLSVKRLLEARENIPAEDQLLSFAGERVTATVGGVLPAAHYACWWRVNSRTVCARR